MWVYGCARHASKAGGVVPFYVESAVRVALEDVGGARVRRCYKAPAPVLGPTVCVGSSAPNDPGHMSGTACLCRIGSTKSRT
jgi:hypothetical protein